MMDFVPRQQASRPTSRRARKAPVLGAQARAAALLASTHEANARRLAEAQARAAQIVAEAEAANATYLELAQEQADKMVAPTGTQTARRSPTRLRAAPVAPAARVAPTALADFPQLMPPAEADTSSASIDGGVDLIAGPFARFSELATFTRMVRAIQGVVSLDTRQFLKGSVHLRLRYEDPLPLAVRLAELVDFAPSIESASTTRVELRVHLAVPRPADEDIAESLGHAA